MTKPVRWTRAEWEAATMWLLRRSRGNCEVCQKPLDGRGVRHHRKRRREGGDTLPNLLLIHPACHDRLHRHPAWAREHGWIVSVHEPDPSRVPVDIGGCWWTLLEDGTRRLVA